LMSRFFHVTSSLNRESVRQYGLDWTRMALAPGIAGSPGPEQAGCFLCRDEAEVDWFLGFAETGTLDVWAVDGVEASELVESPEGYLFVPRRVPPEQLELIRHDVPPRHRGTAPGDQAVASEMAPTPLSVRGVDPRDQRWGIDHPRYRVYFWSSDSACDEYELSGGDVHEVIAWAEERSRGGGHYVLYAVVPDDDGVGLIRLAGTDPTEPLDDEVLISAEAVASSGSGAVVSVLRHQPGPVRDGDQRCLRCGFEFELGEAGGPWPDDMAVVRTIMLNGEHMTVDDAEDSSIPWCTDDRAQPQPP
jgi:hypothetical protein